MRRENKYFQAYFLPLLQIMTKAHTNDLLKAINGQRYGKMDLYHVFLQIHGKNKRDIFA